MHYEKVYKQSQFCSVHKYEPNLENYRNKSPGYQDLMLRIELYTSNVDIYFKQDTTYIHEVVNCLS